VPGPSYIIHTPEEICGIRRASRAAASVREKLIPIIFPGMTTGAVDSIAASLISSEGGTSAFLGYRGYPGNVCISLNDEVVHGIGSPDRVIKDGDLVSIDIGVCLDGFIGDTAKSFVAGTASKEAAFLIEITEKALMAGIAAARKNNYVRDISAAVESVAKKAGLGVVREYVGHGCGKQLHEPPEIPNFVSMNRGPRLEPGMTLAIEPMLNIGTHKVLTDPDRWTVRTFDGKLSAHFEHMALVTEQEPEILTCPKT
jgi:methionyl aminopeptidase